MTDFSFCTTAAPEGERLAPDSSAAVGGSVFASSAVDEKPVAGAAHGLQMQRIGGVAFDFVAQAIDLNIHRALVAGAAGPGEHFAGHGFAGVRGQQPQHVALALGQADDFLAAPQIAAMQIEAEAAEMHMGDLRRRLRRLRPPQDRGDAQRELARLEGLGKKIIDAFFEAGDPVLRLGSRGQHQDRHAAALGCVGAQTGGEFESVLAGHHDVEDDEIEGEILERRIRPPRHFRRA